MVSPVSIGPYTLCAFSEYIEVRLQIMPTTTPTWMPGVDLVIENMGKLE